MLVMLKAKETRTLPWTGDPHLDQCASIYVDRHQLEEVCSTASLSRLRLVVNLFCPAVQSFPKLSNRHVFDTRIGTNDATLGTS